MKLFWAAFPALFFGALFSFDIYRCHGDGGSTFLRILILWLMELCYAAGVFVGIGLEREK